LALPPGLGHWLDVGVGMMLVVLGVDLLVRLARRRIHIHPHKHGNGVLHVHAHSHAGDPEHYGALHERHHGRTLTIKAVLVGMVHGLAGSGPLILLTLETLHSVLWGLVYILCFALGTLAGMALLTAVISLPLRFAERRLSLVHTGLQGVIGLTTILIGAYLLQWWR
jgi:ABC-type nickel/cobalt efflux system permease component RcnA